MPCYRASGSALLSDIKLRRRPPVTPSESNKNIELGISGDLRAPKLPWRTPSDHDVILGGTVVPKAWWRRSGRSGAGPTFRDATPPAQVVAPVLSALAGIPSWDKVTGGTDHEDRTPSTSRTGSVCVVGSGADAIGPSSAPVPTFRDATPLEMAAPASHRASNCAGFPGTITHGGSELALYELLRSSESGSYTRIRSDRPGRSLFAGKSRTPPKDQIAYFWILPWQPK